jgi:hypothetical protein
MPVTPSPPVSTTANPTPLPATDRAVGEPGTQPAGGGDGEAAAAAITELGT